MSVFIPLIDGRADEALLETLQRIGPVIVPALNAASLPRALSRYVLFDHEASLNLDDIVKILDEGAERVVIPLAWASEVVGSFAPERVLVLLDVNNVSAVSEKIRNGVSGVVIKTPTLDTTFVSSISRFF